MKRSIIIALHTGYWILYLMLLATFIMFMEAGGMSKLSENQQHILGFIRIITITTIVPGILGFYSSYFLLFNKFLSKKRIAVLIIAGLAFSFFSGFLSMILINLTTDGVLMKAGGINASLIMMVFMGLLAMIHGIIALVLKGFINWYTDIKLKEELKQKNFDIELALIKSQLNPHFLFNSINNIDVLIKKDADKASLYLNKLSDIMRFMLYETKIEKIPLQQEINYINKYIDLQKIRTSNVDFVNYSTVVEFGQWQVSPMIFIPFIENAFKYASNKKTNNGIEIKIIATKDMLTFYCKNHYGNNILLDGEPGGIGNELINKRLQLLYPGQHELKTENENQVYLVYLTIYANKN